MINKFKKEEIEKILKNRKTIVIAIGVLLIVAIGVFLLINRSGERIYIPEWLQVGDFVEFTPTLETHIVPANLSGHREDQEFSTEDLQWRVMSIDDDKITLISNTPTEARLTLRGAYGYNNAIDILNDVSEALYSSDGVGVARSMNFEDVERVVGRTGEPMYDRDSDIRGLDVVDPSQVGEELAFPQTFRDGRFFLASRGMRTIPEVVTFSVGAVELGSARTGAEALLRSFAAFDTRFAS